jgi:Predicted methylated DNA-protein cysteine methyltransferase
MPVNLQQNMLEQEGVMFNEKGRCDLNKHLWMPEDLKIEEESHPDLLEP